MEGVLTNVSSRVLSVHNYDLHRVYYLHEPEGQMPRGSTAVPIVMIDRRPGSKGFVPREDLQDTPTLVFTLIQAQRDDVLYAFVGRQRVRTPQPG